MSGKLGERPGNVAMARVCGRSTRRTPHRRAQRAPALRPAQRVGAALGSLLLAGALSGPAAGAPGSVQQRAAGGDPPSRLLVSAYDFYYTLSRPRIDPGPSIVQMANNGEDEHDLVMRRVGGTRQTRMGIVEPGGLGELRWRLRAGSRYLMWCDVADHRQLGMEATIQVKRERR